MGHALRELACAFHAVREVGRSWTNHVCVDNRFDRDRTSGPGEQSSFLGNDPIFRAIEMEDGERRGRGPNGDQSSHGAARGDLSSVNYISWEP